MTEQSKLRVGVIGLGMGRGHLKTYQSIPDKCEVGGICDTDPARLQEIGDTYGVADRYTDPEEMFDHAGLDAISLAVPNTFHCPLTCSALEKGLHVLCEKPMAMSVEEAEKMKAAAEKSGRTLMINFSSRFNPTSFALKQQTDAGELGDIYFGRTVWHRRRGMPGFGGWFGRKEMSGGGPLIDLGVHRIDLALWMMGHPEPAAVNGAVYNVIAREKAERENKPFSVEDLACGMIRFKNGATLIVEASWALNIKDKDQIGMTLYGDKGGLLQGSMTRSQGADAEFYIEEGGNLYTKQLDRVCTPAPSSYEEFVDCILEDREPLATADEGIKVQKILEGLYESAEKGREVVLS